MRAIIAGDTKQSQQGKLWRPGRTWLGVLVACAAVSVAPANAQTTAEQAEAPPAREVSRILLDAPVERSEYRLGPGDVVSVSIFGEMSLLREVPVTPEGTLVIGSVGVVNVLDRNLDEAEARVREMVGRFYRNVEVHVGLSQVRTFKVFVIGEVPNPGVQIATAMSRVSEVLPRLDTLATETTEGVVSRDIQLRRRNGETLRVDLVRFSQTGDLDANPRLREGDAVIVAEVDESISISGRVFFPGEYAFRPGESLAELLRVANGTRGFPADAADTIRVARFVGPQQREIVSFTQTDALEGAGRTFLLQPFDAVYVASRSNFMQQDWAQVRGEVARPGRYPIVPYSTTVGQLIAMAGGLTPEASLTGATLKRQPETWSDRALEQAFDSIPFEFLSADEQRIRQIRATSDESNVVVDFERLVTGGDGANDQVLLSGDELRIPERRNEVVVLGAVRRPGIVGFDPAWSPSQYIALAGGYSNRADRDDVVVLRARMGTRVDLSDVRFLEAGDKIVVPYRVPRTPLERLSGINAVVSTISATVVAIYTLSRLF